MSPSKPALFLLNLFSSAQVLAAVNETPRAASVLIGKGFVELKAPIVDDRCPNQLIVEKKRERRTAFEVQANAFGPEERNGFAVNFRHAARDFDPPLDELVLGVVGNRKPNVGMVVDINDTRFVANLASDGANRDRGANGQRAE